MNKGELVKPFSLEVVKHVVWDCDYFKSPGPDETNLGFIKDLWPGIKDDLMQFFVDFH